MAIIDDLTEAVGGANVLRGADAAGFSSDWTGAYRWAPLVVVRPADTQQVAQVVRVCAAAGVPVVPVSGNTGMAGGTHAEGSVMVSLERMNRIREIRPDARVAVVEAGVVLSTLHEAAAEHGLMFPLTFGARQSARIGGCLSTNAGGSNVLRYGNTRDLCLGVEVVLASGEVMNLMSALHKDNSGYNLKHLVIGAEGTLGIVTAAMLKLVPKPRAYATAMVAAPSLDAALVLLNRLQEATGGAVEAFEYMPGRYMEAYVARGDGARAPFDRIHDVNILVEVGATAPRDATPGPDGQVPIVFYLEEVLSGMLESGDVLDAVVAQTGAQRAEMWARREAAASLSMARKPLLNNDIAVPVDRVAEFLRRADQAMEELSPGSSNLVASHLGDGNVHYAVWPASQDPAVHDRMVEAVEEIVLSLGGSFSAEHGIGRTKLPSMARRKDKVAVAAMRAIKAALDPKGIMNPGKVIPG